jgi:ribosomal protein S18 acetylase RimI-like enzyme
MHKIERLTPAHGRADLQDLIQLLQDSVDNGASVGFIPPLQSETAERYWLDVFDEIAHGKRIVLVVRDLNRVAGSVQLALVQKENGRHRAEVEKLLVHTRFRKRGIGRALMVALEKVAREKNRTLLVLDTLEGNVAEDLYRKCGYTAVGAIPQYASDIDGAFHATVIFYRLLDAHGKKNPEG